MLTHLVILLSNDSTSYCYYEPKCEESFVISMDSLKKGILYAFKENLSIQFAFPDYDLPDEYNEIINGTPHFSIGSPFCKRDLDIICFNWSTLLNVHFSRSKSYVLRTTMDQFICNVESLFPYLSLIGHLSVVFLDTTNLNSSLLDKYAHSLDLMSDFLVSVVNETNYPQISILTDRTLLSKMNNCNAGCESITLAPDGNFYLCPAFYYDNASDCGNPDNGLLLGNKHLFRIEFAPICRGCDAYQCRRCVWHNIRMTDEVNTPSYEQCYLSHIERKASLSFIRKLKENNIQLDIKEIPEISYMDPFELIYNQK